MTLTEVERYQADYVNIGRQHGASELAILAALCAGYGENNWDAHTCNSSHHCGVWQLSPSLQREHDYRDVPYWTQRAYLDGFWGKGGLIALAKRYPTHSAGYITNLCQGAYANLDQGAQYYDRYLAQARALYARIAGNAAAYGVLPTSSSAPPPARALYVNPLAHARVRGERVDQGVDYAGTGYLVAIADGEVTESIPDGSGWENEGYLEYKITQPGELEGAYIYYAEGITPVVKKHEKIRAGSRVADLRSYMPHGIELGFAAGVGQESYYGYHDGKYDEVSSTRPGIAFNNLVVRLGGPSGIVSRDVTGKFPEYMQSGEPAPTVSKEPSSGVTGNPLGGGVFMSGQFDWPGSVLSAFVQIQRGAGNGSHHSHSAWFAARGITYVPKSD